MEGHLNILDNSILSTLWQQFGEGPFLFQQNGVSCAHKVRAVQSWFADTDVEELDWPAHCPDFNPMTTAMVTLTAS